MKLELMINFGEWFRQVQCHCIEKSF